MGDSRFRFTLRDMMVTIAIVTILLSIVIQGTSGAREAARRAQCSNNAKQIALGLQTFSGENNSSFPEATVTSPGLPPEKRLSWMVRVLAFMEQMPGIYFDEKSPWDAEVNRLPNRGTGEMGGPIRVVRSTEPIRFSFFTCPSNANPSDPRLPGPTHYIGIAGMGSTAPNLTKDQPGAGMFRYQDPTYAADIKDGQVATMIVVESAWKNGPWTAGGFATVRGLDPSRRPYLGPGRQFGGLHPGGANVAFVDGSVRFLRDSIDPKVLEAIATIAGEETVDISKLDHNCPANGFEN